MKIVSKQIESQPLTEAACHLLLNTWQIVCINRWPLLLSLNPESFPSEAVEHSFETTPSVSCSSQVSGLNSEVLVKLAFSLE